MTTHKSIFWNTSCETKAWHWHSHHTLLIVLCMRQHHILYLFLRHQELGCVDVNVFKEGHCIIHLGAQWLWHHWPIQHCAYCVPNMRFFTKLKRSCEYLTSQNSLYLFLPPSNLEGWDSLALQIQTESHVLWHPAPFLLPIARSGFH